MNDAHAGHSHPIMSGNISTPDLHHHSGNFIGHFGIGLFFNIFGLIHLLQVKPHPLSLQPNQCSKRYLRSPFLYTFKLCFVMFASFLGLFVEMLKDKSFNWATVFYTKPHDFMYVMVFIGSVVALLNFFQILKDHVFAFVFPMGICLMGMAFWTHDESTPLSEYTHQTLSILTIAVGLGFAMEFVLRIYLLERALSPRTIEVDGNLTQHLLGVDDGAESILCCGDCKRTEGELNPIYIHSINSMDITISSFNALNCVVLGNFWICISYIIHTNDMSYLGESEARILTFTSAVTIFILSMTQTIVLLFARIMAEKCVCTRRSINWRDGHYND